MTTLYLDTEFNSSSDGQLLSIALVGPGCQFYLEIVPHEPIHPWVAEHVAPLFTGPAMTYENAQQELAKFLGIWESVHVIADWPTDFMHLSRMLDFGEGRCIPTKITMELVYGVSTKPDIPHHALSDAKALMNAIRAMKGE